MNQKTLSDRKYSNQKHTTKHEEFLDIIPWGEWVGLIQTLHYKGKRGRPSWRIKTMLYVSGTILVQLVG